MRKLLAVPALLVLATALLATPSASASSEAGWNCTATGSEAGWTLLAVPQAGSPVSPLVKESPGVIVGWAVRVGEGLGPVAQQLGVFRAVSASEFTKVAESGIETFAGGFTQYPARIPVQAGDFLGFHGPSETLYCGGGPSALFEGSVAVGETKPFVPEGAVKPPVSAVVESDFDGDGYGDQSQDGCPTSAAFHGDCPLMALGVGEVAVGRRAITIEVNVNVEASVEALGEVRWSAPPPSRRGARRSDVARRVRVGLHTSAPVTVVPGTRAVISVPLPEAVRRRLSRIAPRRALRARIDVRGVNLANYVGTQELRVRLPGRKLPRRGR